jgi:hypothetical protein
MFGRPTLALGAVAITSAISLTLRLWFIRRSVPVPH